MPRKLPVEIMPGCRGRISVPELRRIATYVLDQEDVAKNVGAEVVIGDSDTVRELNRLYRGRDEPTDVLSFAASEGEAFMDAPDEEPSLGEVIVCLPVAEAQATAANRAVTGEIAHLLVHGLLHILGHDHEEHAEGEEMKVREDELLAALGYEGGYEHGH
ncbi:MAG: rRNA maturation RNase YbeY [Dehalococcoidia bacterium]